MDRLLAELAGWKYESPCHRQAYLMKARERGHTVRVVGLLSHISLPNEKAGRCQHCKAAAAAAAEAASSKSKKSKKSKKREVTTLRLVFTQPK